MIVYRYDASTNGTRYELMAQRINWDGNKIGSPFQIVAAADRTYSTPRVIWKEAYDEYLIVWGTRDTATGLPTDIGEKLIDHEGTVRYATVISSADYPYDPDMVWDPIQERYLIVWCYINASGKKAVMGDIRDGNANRMGGIVTPFIIYSSTTNDLWSPRVGTNGIFFFTAFEYVYSDSDHDIYGAWVNSDATLVIPVGLVTSGANEITPALATSLDRQEIMVLFERASTGPQEVWLKPISNTISADEVSICNYDYWDCISAAGAWGDPGYLFTYASHGIVIPDGKYHIYGRFYATNVVYLPLIKK